MQEHVSLKKYTTLKLGGQARYFSVVKGREDIIFAVDFAQRHNISIVPLGGGSNLVVSDILKDALFLKMENKQLDILEESRGMVKISVGAGLVWDDFVAFTVSKNFSGIEAMSLIPGTCGATPIQNVGAYGQEVSNVIESVTVYNIEDKKFFTLSNSDCQFSYRDSIFKNSLRGKCIVESVVFRLKKSKPTIPDYPKVIEVLREIQKIHSRKTLLQQIRQTIIQIRSEKLPDPNIIPNVGSFFKNVIINKSTLNDILKIFPDTPYFSAGDKYKIPAGWLIEKSGFKGHRENGVGVSDKNALVLVNISASKTQKILDLAKTIQDKVKSDFGISLEIEPQIIS